ncbi:SU10 major capsid protein, partial [Actinophytocola sediminis]
MSGITGMGTTYGLPNYHGELFALSPEDTPLMSAIGGLTGGDEVDSKAFEWQGYDLRQPDQRVALEGAAAPTGTHRVRQSYSNVVEIHHERVTTSYTKQAATGHFASDASPINGPNPVDNEHNWGIENTLKEMGRDVNWTLINGQYAAPTDNTAPRKTRGLIQAVS